MIPEERIYPITKPMAISVDVEDQKFQYGNQMNYKPGNAWNYLNEEEKNKMLCTNSVSGSHELSSPSDSQEDCEGIGSNNAMPTGKINDMLNSGVNQMKDINSSS